MSKDLLVEIGTEPLPARFVPPALEQLASKAEAALKEERLAFASVRALGTYRRLTLEVRGLAEKSEPLQKRALGPAEGKWRDEKGEFTPQAAGFARGQGVDPKDLIVVDSPKGRVLAVEKTVPGEPTPAILKRLVPALAASLEFPKTMVWDATKLRFGRPIRSLLVLFGNKAVPAALGNVKSAPATRGLPALGAKPVKVPSLDKYARVLRDKLVLVEPEERLKALHKTLDASCPKGFQVEKDAELLRETLWMVEHPTGVQGALEERFLKVPAALIRMVFKKQLKFFPVVDAKGRLTPHFVGVRDGASEGQKHVREGFERVVGARLADALFFFEKDLKTSLEDKRQRLKDVAFLAGYGSLLERSDRTGALASALAGQAGADGQAAGSIGRLAFADLTSEVVREFPELQGVMGGEYARAEGLPEGVAAGIADFYKPAGPEDSLPGSKEAALASLAAKIDTLCANFAAGNIPTGSEDPFALRRAGAGAVRILLDKQLPLDLAAAVRAHLAALKPGSEAAASALLAFLWGRAETAFSEKGFPVDEVRAIGEGGLSNLPKALRNLEALHRVRKEPEFETLAAADKRASNILKQASWKNGGDADPARFLADEEKDLWQALQEVGAAVDARLKQDQYEQGLKELVRLKAPLDRFFDKVMVMDKDEAVKKNRLALLAALKKLFSSVADLSKLQ